MEHVSKMALTLNRAPPGAPFLGTFSEIDFVFVGRLLDTILGPESVARSPTRYRSAILELTSDADAVADQEISTKRKNGGKMERD